MRLICFILACATLPAAVIRGSVAENITGNSLAGALVTLHSIGPGSAAASVRTNSSGTFEFSQLAAGGYIVTAARRGFLSLEYGQRQWNSAGTPVNLTADGVMFLDIRLHRHGAITGVVRDENEVGMAGHEVVAYRKADPPQLTQRAKTDDRGVYRISGLEPGLYLIRTTGNAGADASYIPTFSRQTMRVEDAQQVQVWLDEETASVDIRPEQGRLFRFSGAVVPDGYTTTVTLASDMGRRTSGSPVFDFSGLPAGPYEIYAEARDSEGIVRKGAWAQFSLTRDLTGYRLAMQDVRETQFDFTPRQVSGPAGVSVIARRKDLAGIGDPNLLKLENNKSLIAPGRYEMIAIPPDGYYVSQFSGFGRGRQRPDGWNEVSVQYFTAIRIGISGGGSSVHGLVKSAGNPVAGAPVFLEAWDPDTRTRAVELRSTRSDASGRYSFIGLPPGAFRLMASFEYLAPDSAAIDLSLPQTLRLEPHADLAVDLELFGRP